MFQIDSHTKFTPDSRIDPIVSLLKEKFEIGSLTYELSDCQKNLEEWFEKLLYTLWGLWLQLPPQHPLFVPLQMLL
jgi:hypothetical protein